MLSGSNLSSAAASTYISLAAKESDNNVKLIVLDRLDTLHSRHGHVLDVLIMDIVQILARSAHSSSV
jgi:coatomer subunit beta